MHAHAHTQTHSDTHTHTVTHTHTHTHTHTQVFQEPVLNAFRSLGEPAWSEARQVIH